jgi:2-polyprenyl-3-methyl-5-hydroxy-6-metoxy-1,4-benzoquinol methylase
VNFIEDQSLSLPQMQNSFDPENERNFLDSLVQDYRDVSPYSRCKKEIIHEVIQSHMVDAGNKTGLQLGCSNGYETAILASQLKTLAVVDGSSIFINKLKESNAYPNVRFTYSLFEEYALPAGETKYDFVFCNYILEHVFETDSILKMIRSVIADNGIFFAVVPNANAFSRQLALDMKLITGLRDLTENDHRHGHRRVYDMQTIKADVTNAGFDIIDSRGIIFKILADFQLNKIMEEKIMGDAHIRSLYNLGLQYPELTDSIFIAARPA